MKVEISKQQETAQQMPGGARVRRGGAPQKRSAEKKGDSVEFSGSLEREMKSRQAERDKRVDSIKELVDSGRYRINSREVAEKILSGSSII